MKTGIVVFLLSASTLISNGQAGLLPIDSIYLKGIGDFYQTASKAKDLIWPGMELSPVCLYRVNGPAIFYNHPNPPKSFIKLDRNIYLGSQKELHLLGATQVEINGVLTAIADYGLESYLSPYEVYAELFHELHHAYQRNFVKSIEFDNPATLLVYPEVASNDAIKLYEQQLLLKMAFASDTIEFKRYLNKFYSARIAREAIVGTRFIRYEKTVENMEGPAFYCEHEYYSSYVLDDKVLKNNYISTHFWSILNTPYYGRNNLRLRHLSAGMAMCYILDRYFDDSWKIEYYSGKTDLFDFFISRFNPQITELPNLQDFNSICSFNTKRILQQREKEYESFSNQSGVKVILKFSTFPQFQGFDPMHANAINDSTILHSTLLSLKKDESKLLITNKKISTIVKGQVWFVKKVVFFVDSKSELKFNGNKVSVSSTGIDLVWEGEIVTEDNTTIELQCK